MKKILLVTMCVLLLVGCNSKKEDTKLTNTNTISNEGLDENSNTNTNTNNLNTVHLYLFHSSTCEHCQEEISWIRSIEKDYPYLQIHYYEVSENYAIYQKVKKAMGVNAEGVPLTFIGNDYYVGFSESKGRKFSRIIKEESELDKCDVISAIINDEDVDNCVKYNEKRA